MHLVRRGSLPHALESDPKFPAHAFESELDPKERFRKGLLGGSKAFSASVDHMQAAGAPGAHAAAGAHGAAGADGAAEHSFNGEDETMQVNY